MSSLIERLTSSLQAWAYTYSRGYDPVEVERARLKVAPLVQEAKEYARSVVQISASAIGVYALCADGSVRWMAPGGSVWSTLPPIPLTAPETCPGCEGRPIYPNDPCHVCGGSAKVDEFTGSQP